MAPDGLLSPCRPNVSQELHAKEIPTAPATGPDPSWLSAPHTQLGRGLDNYRGTLTQKPEKTLA